jgi:hypothetical protein
VCEGGRWVGAGAAEGGTCRIRETQEGKRPPDPPADPPPCPPPPPPKQLACAPRTASNVSPGPGFQTDATECRVGADGGTPRPRTPGGLMRIRLREGSWIASGPGPQQARPAADCPMGSCPAPIGWATTGVARCADQEEAPGGTASNPAPAHPATCPPAQPPWQLARPCLPHQPASRAPSRLQTLPRPPQM